MHLYQRLLCCYILFSNDKGLFTYWYNSPNMQRFSLLHDRVIGRIFQWTMPLIHIRILPGCRNCIDWCPITISSSGSAYNFTRYGMDWDIYVIYRRSATTKWRVWISIWYVYQDHFALASDVLTRTGGGVSFKTSTESGQEDCTLMNLPHYENTPE